jgi:hypothetical protein
MSEAQRDLEVPFYCGMASCVVKQLSDSAISLRVHTRQAGRPAGYQTVSCCIRQDEQAVEVPLFTYRVVCRTVRVKSTHFQSSSLSLHISSVFLIFNDLITGALLFKLVLHNTLILYRVIKMSMCT